MHAFRVTCERSKSARERRIVSSLMFYYAQSTITIILSIFKIQVVVFFSEHTQQKCQKIPLCNQHDVSFSKMCKSNQLNPLSLLFSQFSSELVLCRPAATVSRSQVLCFIFLVRRRGKYNRRPEMLLLTNALMNNNS